MRAATLNAPRNMELDIDASHVVEGLEFHMAGQQAAGIGELTDTNIAEADQQGPARNALYDKFASSKLGHRVVAGLASFTLAGGAGALEASTAAADTPAPNTVTLNVSRNAISTPAESVASKKIIFGEDVRTKGKISKKDCHWTKGAFTNSVRLANGKLHYYRDSKRGYLCRAKNSPTGWVKMKGGETGRPCKNPSRDKPMPKSDTKVINVSKLNTSFTLSAFAKADAGVVCPGAWASGSAVASVNQKFNLKTYLKQDSAGQRKISIKLYDQAYAKATAAAHCDSTTTEVPPAPKFLPNVEVDNPNHVGTNGTIAFCERESDPDGYIASRVFKIKQGGGNFISGVYPGNDPNEYCITYRGRSSSAGPNTILSAEVTDNDAQTASADSAPFPIVDLPQ